MPKIKEDTKDGLTDEEILSELDEDLVVVEESDIPEGDKAKFVALSIYKEKLGKGMKKARNDAQNRLRNELASWKKKVDVLEEEKSVLEEEKETLGKELDDSVANFENLNKQLKTINREDTDMTDEQYNALMSEVKQTREATSKLEEDVTEMRNERNIETLREKAIKQAKEEKLEFSEKMVSGKTAEELAKSIKNAVDVYKEISGQAETKIREELASKGADLTPPVKPSVGGTKITTGEEEEVVDLDNLADEEYQKRSGELKDAALDTMGQ